MLILTGWQGGSEGNIDTERRPWVQSLDLLTFPLVANAVRFAVGVERLDCINLYNVLLFPSLAVARRTPSLKTCYYNEPGQH